MAYILVPAHDEIKTEPVPIVQYKIKGKQVDFALDAVINDSGFRDISNDVVEIVLWAYDEQGNRLDVRDTSGRMKFDKVINLAGSFGAATFEELQTELLQAPELPSAQVVVETPPPEPDPVVIEPTP